jgi:hypothetical protein
MLLRSDPARPVSGLLQAPSWVPAGDRFQTPASPCKTPLAYTPTRSRQTRRAGSFSLCSGRVFTTRVLTPTACGRNGPTMSQCTGENRQK